MANDGWAQKKKQKQNSDERPPFLGLPHSHARLSVLSDMFLMCADGHVIRPKYFPYNK